ncbi:MAG: hypothetical protein GX434_05515 [Peptococcaceae bacterium]|nr:hypothetical protein [Peptococcaceae bacterium]
MLLNPIIIKLGGSLIYHRNGEILRNLGDVISEYSSEYPLLIVPGGGPFADVVREFGKQLELCEETCHFMALSGMDQYAYVLKDFIPGSVLTDFSDLESTIPAILSPPFKPQILLCSSFLRQVPENHLERSWDVTSDSIAAYLAKRLNSSLLVILKSTDIDPGIQEPDVDSFFHKLLPLGFPVWFINGLYPDRLSRLMQTGSTQGIYLSSTKSYGELF